MTTRARMDIRETVAGSIIKANNQLTVAVSGGGGADEFARKYVSEFFLRKKLHNQLQEMLGNLRVYCRVRPPSAHELEQDVVGDKNGHTTVEVPNNETLLVSDKEDPKRPRRRYDYSKVYGPASTQEEVFSDTEPLMTSVLDGYNVCVFAYGQSGSGKTYTMEGTADSPGLALRAVDALFLGAEERRAQGYETELSIGLVEIYNETLGDLLADPTEDHSHKKLEILKDASLGMYAHHENKNKNKHTNEKKNKNKSKNKNTTVATLKCPPLPTDCPPTAH
eukprot:CAMPEP_0179908038 /NCGR_PEP_ID=MMETSP0982-20121206/44293_1 /TAXON_ID=483367 /ORGANISM="non described non described, Strain CCMP 2436" /LENGTH=278 /DNA_ID=CAMNT_0021809043 /DNA_START=260 /DNA_END=1097 /DNA_ORIENTATION=+